MISPAWEDHSTLNGAGLASMGHDVSGRLASGPASVSTANSALVLRGGGFGWWGRRHLIAP
eukprot:2988532-Prymnesium_polylepis.1